MDTKDSEIRKNNNLSMSYDKLFFSFEKNIINKKIIALL